MAARLLCDAMLSRLGRWLRAAGYDTLIAEDVAEDRHLLEITRADGRVLITRDRELAGRGTAEACVLHLRSDRAAEQAQELRRHLHIDWLHAPFTRCVVDNAPLRAARSDEWQAVPPKARALGGPFLTCPACGRLYWQGSHHRRMAARLASWQRDKT